MTGIRAATRHGLTGSLELGMAEVALVFVEAVLGAVETALLLELRLAKPATVFVATVLLAPQAQNTSGTTQSRDV